MPGKAGGKRLAQAPERSPGVTFLQAGFQDRRQVPKRSEHRHSGVSPWSRAPRTSGPQAYVLPTSDALCDPPRPDAIHRLHQLQVPPRWERARSSEELPSCSWPRQPRQDSSLRLDSAAYGISDRGLRRTPARRPQGRPTLPAEAEVRRTRLHATPEGGGQQPDGAAERVALLLPDWKRLAEDRSGGLAICPSAASSRTPRSRVRTRRDRAPTAAVGRRTGCQRDAAPTRTGWTQATWPLLSRTLART